MMAISVLAACDNGGEPEVESRSVETSNSPMSREPAVDQGDPRICDNRNPLRNAYFGDLHVHTGHSLDAYQQGVRTRPRDAYDFARGLRIPFHDSTIQIDRPLDFAAVTDHAEFLGELGRCTSTEDPLYASQDCADVRRGRVASNRILNTAFAAQESGTLVERVTEALAVLFTSEDPRWNVALCGDDGQQCAEATTSAWQEIIDAAEAAYDRTAACAFTTFVGYEYSGVITGSNYHRNVIFRDARVPATPVSYLDAPLDHQLWARLDQSCRASLPGCDYLAIPHNPNLSNGKLLTPDYGTAATVDETRQLASLRQRAEPLMEIFQHKGASECINGVSDIEADDDDPFCDFEQVRSIGGSTRVLGVDLPTEECEDALGDGGMIDTGCISRNDFLRGALLTGLEEQQRLGINPLQLGVIASTDTHESTPGAWTSRPGADTSVGR